MPNEDPFPTSLSLLDRLGNEPQGESWDRLVELYSPLLRTWMQRYEVQDADVDDLVQDVLIVLIRELPEFRHNRRQGAFRTWLRRIVVNRLQNFWRKRGRDVKSGGSDLARRLKEFEDPQSQLSQIWDREHDRHLTQQLLKQIEPKFTETTRQAFRMLVYEGKKADAVAKELNLSLSAVFTAKSRVLRELRRLSEGLIE